MDYSLNFLKNKDLDSLFNLITEIKNKLYDDITLKNSIIKLSYGKEKNSMSLGNLYIALILLVPRFLLDDELKLNSLVIIDDTENVSKRVSSEIDKIIQLSYKNDISSEHFDEFKKLLVYVIEDLSSFAIQVNELYGNSINIYDILVYLDDPEFVKLVEYRINEKDSYFNISKSMSANTTKIINYFKDKKDAAIYNIIDSVSFGQFQQVFSSIGYKPSVISSDIYPHAVNTNLFLGMRDPKDYFVSSMGARKALITNSVQVRRAGYTARKLALLVLNQFLSEDVDDCGSDDYLVCTINDQQTLNRYHGRYYLNEDENVLDVIDRTDNAFIGKTLKIRTPITCKLDSPHICPTCYGTMSRINNLHISISLILNLTEQLTQRLLSSKHLLQINPEKIELPHELETYFTLDKTTLVAKSSFKLKINSIQIFDDNEIVTNNITIIEPSGSIITINTPNKDLYLDKIVENINLYSPDSVELDINEDDEVFLIQVDNTELVTPLKKLTRLIESDDELNNIDEDTLKDFNTVISEMVELLNQASLESSSLTLELILRELIRDKNNQQERPKEFSDREDYKFLKLTSALLHHPSAAVTLSFERLSYVIENNLFEKNMPSLMDGLY